MHKKKSISKKKTLSGRGLALTSMLQFSFEMQKEICGEGDRTRGLVIKVDFFTCVP